MNCHSRGQLARLTNPSKFEGRSYRRSAALQRIDRRLDALLRRASRSRILFTI